MAEDNWQESTVDECLANASKIAQHMQSITHKEEYDNQKKALEVQIREAEKAYNRKIDILLTTGEWNNG